MTPDVVVVGAGSAGLTVAHALCRDSDVLLIETGPLTAPSRATRSLTGLPIGAGADRVRRYAEARGRDVVRGNGLGGSAAVNGGYFLRGHQEDYAGWPWPTDRIAAAFETLDGGAAGGGTMRVTAFADGELGDVARRFEAYWRARGPVAPRGSAWPAVGLNRVRSNRVGEARWTAADASASDGGPRLLRATVTGLIEERGSVIGVQTNVGRVDAPETVLAAGTLGTGLLLAPVLGPLVTHEHPERIVRFAPCVPVPAVPLLQSVVHTDAGLELRCYGDDFASYIPGLPRSGVPVGIADMTRPTRGTISLRRGSAVIDLGEPDKDSTARLARAVDEVVAMLGSPEFADVVVPGSIAVDPVTGMSSHAWGTLPLGERTDAGGRIDGLDGVRVVDGSVLPAGLRSGPHASVLVAAALIAETMLRD
ncbi:mycofactocin system GMC family oxidoreductase MftG [Tsukamurella sp. NPDC003166]|uniref:mycofactocin system GMC family oxidoreductase MftG n=1 Tax=Tsukamurella sp. NPDC003166 TaxID=3154444 RepID=UPI00339F2107